MKWSSFLVGVLAGLLLGPGILYMYVAFGRVPVSSFDPELPFETTLASEAVRGRISREMPKSAPITATENNLLAGAEIYRNNCAMCHGLFGENPPAIAAGMYPPPPQLLHGKGVTEDPAGETYWKIANGLRLTGMPGFREMLSPDQMWQLTLLLSHANKLPPRVTDVLTGKAAPRKPDGNEASPR